MYIIISIANKEITTDFKLVILNKAFKKRFDKVSKCYE